MKYLPYGRQWIDKKDIWEVVKVLDSDWVTQGPKIKEFEDALCKYAGAKYAVAVANGTAALHIACLAADIKSGDEVITSPITFAASANCILFCGGKPVFADIQKETANINPKEIIKKVNRKSKAIIPVHFAGLPCDLDEIRKIAKMFGLVIIEDAAHALGAEYRGSKIGSCKYSDMTIFSFHPVKSITTGEGGAVLTNSREYYEKLNLFRQHGVTKNIKRFKFDSDGDWYCEMQRLGYNYRLTDFQCALGISQLKKLDKFIQRRRYIAEVYAQAFKDNEYFNLPQEKKYTKSSWHLYPVRLKNKYKAKKEKIFKELRKNGVGVQVHYIPVYLHPYYKQLGYKKNTCPIAEEFYERELSVPLYPKLSDKEIIYITESVKDTFEKI